MAQQFNKLRSEQSSPFNTSISRREEGKKGRKKDNDLYEVGSKEGVKGDKTGILDALGAI